MEIEIVSWTEQKKKGIIGSPSHLLIYSTEYRSLQMVCAECNSEEAIVGLGRSA